MSQNTSSAVMAQRVEAPDSLDDFPTPPWATRALCEQLRRMRILFGVDTCREPAANRGHMVRPLQEYVANVEASDIHDYGVGFPARDFLAPGPKEVVDWTITNPPFRLAEQFITEALRTSKRGVAMLVRTSFLEGIGRHKRLFSQRPPIFVLQFAERVVMHKGRLSPNGSTATAYAWLVWSTKVQKPSTRLLWIPPCRKRLERPSDYEEGAA